MSNEIDEINEINNDSTSIEIKDSFGTRLINFFKQQKALPPANGVVKTNASMSSLIGLGNLRATLIRMGSAVQNFFTPKKEVEPQTTLEAHVVGDNPKTRDDNQPSQDPLRDKQSPNQHIVIPQPKTATIPVVTSPQIQKATLTVEEIDVATVDNPKKESLTVENIDVDNSKATTQTDQNKLNQSRQITTDTNSSPTHEQIDDEGR